MTTSIDVPAQTGGWRVKEVGRVVLCTRLPHAALKDQLWPIVDSMLERAPAGPELAHTLGSGDWTDPVSRKALERHTTSVSRWPTNGSLAITSLRSRYEFSVDYHGQAEVFVRRGWATNLTVSFPREQLLATPDELEQWFIRVLRLTEWSTGTLGLALEGNEWEIYPLAWRHLAVDISSPSSDAHDLGRNIVGLGWLTFLSKAQVRSLGGVRQLKKDLSPAVAHVVDVEGGLLVRLERAPTRGTTSAERRPWRAAARRLAPQLHRPKRVLSMLSHSFQLAWHERFLHPLAAYRRAFTREEQLWPGVARGAVSF